MKKAGCITSCKSRQDRLNQEVIFANSLIMFNRDSITVCRLCVSMNQTENRT